MWEKYLTYPPNFSDENTQYLEVRGEISKPDKECLLKYHSQHHV